MKLIADSGSTKTEWVCFDETKTFHFNTIGFNPYFVDEAIIVSELQNNFPGEISLESVSDVYFYGSGCGKQKAKDLISNVLQRIFVKATIIVETDLVGAAIACYGDKSGIIAILGTGMSVGFWNGKTLEMPIPSLGFILGDEGSGADLGKRFISAMYKKQLPIEIEQKFIETYSLSVTDVIERVYKQPRPNAFLASFVPFFLNFRTLPIVDKIIQNALQEFIKIYIHPMMQIYHNQNIAFVGSLALVFEQELSVLTQKEGFRLETIVAKPLNLLEQRIRECK